MQNLKKPSLVFCYLAVICFSLGALTSYSTAQKTGHAGKVTYLKGKVEAHRQGSWVKLKKDAKVYGGENIRTQKKSRVEIVLVDKSVIRLGSRSKVKINKAMFESDGKKQFSGKLLRGQAYAMVSKLTGGDSSFKIETSNAVAGVRGTAFRIDANKDRSTVVRVYTGAVAVSNAPIYAKPGKPSKSSGKFQMPRQGVKPGGPGRVEVAGPEEVTKKEWEEFVAKAMQEVRVAANGEISEPVAFDAEADAADEWVAWNKSRDKELEQ
jgi:ferric-dicitrate binding protein FerR (iron transport regulator)